MLADKQHTLSQNTYFKSNVVSVNEHKLFY